MAMRIILHCQKPSTSGEESSQQFMCLRRVILTKKLSMRWSAGSDIAGTRLWSSFWTDGVSTETRDEFGNTGLMLAVQSGSNHMCKIVMQQGEDTKSQNKRGQTALHVCGDDEGR